jgi:hypothetical protein
MGELLDKDGIADDIHLFNDKLREWEDYHELPSAPRSSMGRHPTSGFWQRNPRPGCYRSLETLHI